MSNSARITGLLSALVLAHAFVGCAGHVVPGSDPGGLSGSNGSTSTCGNGISIGAAAYVYVASNRANAAGNAQIIGLSAAADGILSPIPSSPFPTPSKSLPGVVASRSFVFAADGFNIDSFKVHNTGCLSLENSLAAGQGPPENPTLEPSILYLDRQNVNLYSFDFNPPDGLQSKFASYSFDSNTGQLSQVGTDVVGGNGTLSFASNNRFAMGTFCSLRGGRFIAEYRRDIGGALTFLRDVAPPVGVPGETWCANGTAADGSGHILIEVTPSDPGSPQVDPNNSPRMAIYTFDNFGNVSTTSTYLNMFNSQFGPATYLFSPDSRFLAAAGFLGLQVFTWDSTSMTLAPLAMIKSGASCSSGSASGGGCRGIGFGNVAWDGNDHLYTILGQQLLVFSASPLGVFPTPGSPYTIPKATWVTVLPLNPQ